MRTVLSIEGKVKQLDKQGKEYMLTYLTVDDGTEGTFWSDANSAQIHIGDKVVVMHDTKWDRIKFQLTKSKA